MFSVTFYIELCIDGSCDEMSMFRDVKVPIPVCTIDWNTFELPGDGTVDGFVQQLGDSIGDEAIDLVIKKIGLDVSNV